MKQFLIAFVSLIHVHSLNGYDTKIWTPSSSLNVADNWEDNEIPCEKDTVVFDSFDNLVKIPDFSAQKIVFPKDGAFVFNSKMTLSLKETSPTCKQAKERKFKQMKDYFWLSGDNWRSAIDNNNQAKPHEERLPCDKDFVVFPPNTSYEVDLQYTPHLFFKKITLEESEYSPSQFHDFLLTKIGQISFKNSDNTLFLDAECPHLNCPCHVDNEALLEQLCSNEKPKCQVPQCIDPIQPIGFCCTICGSMLQVDIEEDEESEFGSFRRKIAEGR